MESCGKLETNIIDFEDLFNKYYSSVFAYVKKRIPNYHDSEELASEIFQAIHKYYMVFDSEKSSLSTWIFMIVKSRVKNYYRKKKTIDLDIDEVSNMLEYENEIYSSIESECRSQQIKDQVTLALEKLDERSKKIVVMKYFLNYSYDDISNYIGITTGNVRVIISRSLKKMKKNISNIELEE